MAGFIGLITEYWGVIVGVAGFFFGWVKFTAAKTSALKDDLNKIEKRLDVLEQGYKSVASKEDIHKISIQVERLTGEMKRIDSVLTRTEAILQRQEEYLLNGGRK